MLGNNIWNYNFGHILIFCPGVYQPLKISTVCVIINTGMK